MRLPFLILLALPYGTAWTVERYVSGTGSDGNDGLSILGAYRTLGKAATVVEAGDTVWVLNGTYAPFTMRRSGAQGAPITWKARSGHAPELVSNAWNAISVDASWQVIDGLTLTGNNDNVTLAQAEADYEATTPSGLYNGNGILLDNRNKTVKQHHLTVRNCIVRKFCGGGIATIGADYTVVERCDIYENAWYSRYGCSGVTIFPVNADAVPGYRNIIRGNRMWNNRGLVKWKQIQDYSDGNGFILDITDADYTGRTLVSDNLVVNNGGSGIHAYKGLHCDIVNNTAYMNGQKVGYADIFAGYSTDVNLFNNIVYSRVGGKANSNTANTAVVYDYNVYFNGTRAVTGAHDLIADPLFVNPGLDPRSADFRLQAGSPARDAGSTVPGVSSTSDIRGVARPRGPAIDRGAYEFIPPPAITSPLGMSGTVGQPLSYQIAASGLPVAFGASGLLVGLVVDTGTGLISGTPTVPGTASVTITADNGGGVASAVLILTIADVDRSPPATPGAASTDSTVSAVPTLWGVTEAGAVVSIYDGADLLGTVTADTAGAWRWTAGTALAAGVHQLTITATDAAGNSSGHSPATTVTVPAPAGSPATASSGGGCGGGSALSVLVACMAGLGFLRRVRLPGDAG